MITFINPKTCQHKWDIVAGTDGFEVICRKCDSYRTLSLAERAMMLNAIYESQKPAQPEPIPYPFPPLKEPPDGHD